MWLCGVLAFRTIGTTDMSFWQIAGPLLAMGLGLPFFFGRNVFVAFVGANTPAGPGPYIAF